VAVGIDEVGRVTGRDVALGINDVGRMERGVGLAMNDVGKGGLDVILS